MFHKISGTQSKIPKNVPLPPSIMVDEIENVEDFRLETLRDDPEKLYRIEILNHQEIKLNVNTTE